MITGASAGVGRAVVREFARHRARVGLIARGEDGLEAARREIERMDGRALVLPANVDDGDADADRVERELGPIDVLVNNAMASVYSPIKEMTAADFKRVTAEPEDPDRPNNLYDPLPGDWGACGRSGDRALASSEQ